MRRIIVLLLVLSFFLLFPPFVLAASNTPKLSAPRVSATIPGQAVAGDTTPPTTPILLRPTDGTATSDTTPEFVWSQSSDPNGNTVTYTFHLDGVATFLGISNSDSSSGTGYTATIDSSEVRLTPTTALADGTYSWKIIAYDLVGNQTSSTSWSFTIDTLAPFLTLTNLDNYHNPTITTESNFALTGPKIVPFTLLTEPYASVRLSLTLDLVGSAPLIYIVSTNHTGQANFSPYLQTGLYSVSLSVTDHANFVTALPTFSLTLTPPQATIALPSIPGVSLPPSLTIPLPHLPLTTPSLPASISVITSTSFSPLILLAFIVILSLSLLLFLLFHHRPNLLLTTKSPLPDHFVIWHSHPSLRGHKQLGVYRFHNRSSVSITSSHSQLTTYKLFIPHLSRFSTLTIRPQNSDTTDAIVLSLTTNSPQYTISL